jgi:minimal PKS acyl carrier protein
MSTITIEDVHRILVESAGAAGDWEPREIIDESFETLGYDSLALIESAGLIKREYGVDIPDDEVTELETPRQLLDLVNTTLTA